MGRLPTGERLLVILSLTAIVVMSLLWAHPGTVIAQGDRSTLLDPLNQASACSTAWTNERAYLGQPSTCFGYFGYLVLYGLAVAAFGTTYGQVVIAALLFGLGWLGGFVCARTLRISPLAAFVVAWAFALNPSRQTSILILPPFDITVVVVPWLFFLLLRAAAPEGRARATLWIAIIATVAGPALAITPQLILEIVLGYLAWLPLAARFSANRVAYYAWAARASGIAVAVSVWWIVPTAIAYLSGPITRVVSLTQNSWIYAQASLLNELRFLSNWSWRVPEYFPWAQISDRTALLYGSEFVLAFGCIGALLLARGRALFIARYCGALALILLFISKGIHPPLAFLNEWFFKLPAMFLFLEPYAAITIAALGFAICLGILLDALPVHLPRLGEALRPVAVAIALCAAFIGGTPIITGAVFHEASGFEPSMHVRVPGYWLELAEHLNASHEPGSVLLLPADTAYQVDYEWGYYGSDALARDLLHRAVYNPGVATGYVEPGAQLSLDKRLLAMFAADSALTVPVLRDLGVRYVVFRGDVRSASGFPMSFSQANVMFAAFPLEEFGPLALYDLGPASSPLTSSTSVIFERNPDSLDAGDYVELRALEERLPRIGGRLPAGLGELVEMTETEMPDTRDAYRVLWHDAPGSVGGSYSYANHNLDARLRASYALDQTPNTTLTRRMSELARLPTDIGVPIPRIIGRGVDQSTRSFEVLNPSRHIIYCEMSIGMRERHATLHALYVNHRMVDQRDVPGGPLPQWLRFRHIRLLPGPNLLELSVWPRMLPSYETLLPPRSITGGAWDPLEGQIKFDRIEVAAATPSLPSISTRGPGFEVDIPALDAPTLLLEGAESRQGRTVGWLFDALYRGSRYQCYDGVFVGTPADLSDSLRQCFEVMGLRLDDADMQHLSLVSLSLLYDPALTPHGVPFTTLRLSYRIRRPMLVEVEAAQGHVRMTVPPLQGTVFQRALPPSANAVPVTVAGSSSDVSTLAVGGPPLRSPAERDLPLLFHINGLYVGRIERAGTQVIAIRDLYHATWFAVTLSGGPRVLQHFRADGWRNAWLADHDGLFIAMNGLVVFQIIFAAFALFVLVYVWRVMR